MGVGGSLPGGRLIILCVCVCKCVCVCVCPCLYNYISQIPIEEIG